MQKQQLVGFWKWQKHPLSFHISPTPLELLKTIDNEILDTIDNVVLCKTFSLVTAISDNDPDNRWVEFLDFSSLSIVSKSSLSIVSKISSQYKIF